MTELHACKHIVNPFGLQEAPMEEILLQVGHDVMVDKATAMSCCTLATFG